MELTSTWERGKEGRREGGQKGREERKKGGRKEANKQAMQQSKPRGRIKGPLQIGGLGKDSEQMKRAEIE